MVVLLEAHGGALASLEEEMTPLEIERYRSVSPSSRLIHKSYLIHSLREQRVQVPGGRQSYLIQKIQSFFLQESHRF